LQRWTIAQRFTPQLPVQSHYAPALGALKEDEMATNTQELTAAHKRLLGYAHPLREKIFTILTERSASPSEMTRELGLKRKDLSAVDHHTKRLVKLGCAEVVAERRVGNLPEKIYKATERALVETEEWDTLLEENPAFAMHVLGRGMQVQLDDFVLATKEKTIGEDGDFHLSRTRRVLDAEGLLEGLEIKERCREEMDEVERRSAERRSEGGHDAIAVSDGLALFKVPSTVKR
jgi:hypothetical protein